MHPVVDVCTQAPRVPMHPVVHGRLHQRRAKRTLVASSGAWALTPTASEANTRGTRGACASWHAGRLRQRRAKRTLMAYVHMMVSEANTRGIARAHASSGGCVCTQAPRVPIHPVVHGRLHQRRAKRTLVARGALAPTASEVNTHGTRAWVVALRVPIRRIHEGACARASARYFFVTFPTIA